jgi:endonuclease YncB( thermonuclease family)
MTSTQYVVLDGEITDVGDGDTISFVPRDPERLDLLPPGSNKPKERFGAYPIRLQGIDTPELHISVERPKVLADKLPHAKGAKLPGLPRPVHAQPLGDAAGNYLKKLTGFDEAGMRQRAGVVLVSTTDVYGRLIAYAFVAEDAEDLLGTMASTVDESLLSDALLMRSLNVAMIKGCMAYYTGYSQMPKPHRELFIREVQAAQASRDKHDEKQGIWKLDLGWEAPLKLVDEGAIGPDSGRLILPKLYRRCISYLFSVNADDFSGDLRTWVLETIKTGTDPNLVDMVEIGSERKPFIDLIELSGPNNTTVRLLADPLTMVFVENDTGEQPPREQPLTDR